MDTNHLTSYDRTSHTRAGNGPHHLMLGSVAVSRPARRSGDRQRVVTGRAHRRARQRPRSRISTRGARASTCSTGELTFRVEEDGTVRALVAHRGDVVSIPQGRRSRVQGDERDAGPLSHRRALPPASTRSSRPRASQSRTQNCPASRQPFDRERLRAAFAGPRTCRPYSFPAEHAGHTHRSRRMSTAFAEDDRRRCSGGTGHDDRRQRPRAIASAASNRARGGARTLSGGHHGVRRLPHADEDADRRVRRRIRRGCSLAIRRPRNCRLHRRRAAVDLVRRRRRTRRSPGPWGISYAANLTPDGNTGLGIWTEQMFVDAMRTGRHMGTARGIAPPMPWTSLGHATNEDLAAIYAYLRTIKPIVNHVPDYAPAPTNGDKNHDCGA